MSQALVSIIVPCYQQAQYLKSSLKSVLEQNYNYWECLIVNDGSPDDTEQVASKWLLKDQRFKYIYQDNKGLSGARNTGIEKSLGTYILPLDADDVLHPDFLKEAIDIFERQPALKIVSCYTGFFQDDIENTILIHKPIGTTVKNLLYVNQLVATSLYRKASWEEVGGYDQSMKNGFEDWDFWISIMKTGGHYHVVEKTLFFYRKSKSSMLVNTINYHAGDIKKYIILKHRELYIQDFENFVTVTSFHLNAGHKRVQELKNSAAYKIGRIITKPSRWWQQLQKTMNSRDE